MLQPVLQAFVITLREGLEAFLIVAISLAYLRKSGRGELTRAVHTGIVAALVLSAIGGYILYNAANQELLEGPLALAAAFSVTWMVVHMWRAGRHMKGDIEHHLASSSGKAGAAAFAGVFLFTVLMVTREGMETALLLMQLKETLHLVFGAALGLVGAAALASLWSRYGHRVNLGLFFQVTAIFLFVFTLQLVIYTMHEFFEAGVVPLLDNEFWHVATEPYGPEGVYGEWLTYLMVLIPGGWLAFVWFKDRNTQLSAAH
jgi:high-affinity iron transporter